MGWGLLEEIIWGGRLGELGEVRSKLRARRFFIAVSSSGSFRRMLSHFSLFMCQAGKNPGWVRQEAARTGSHFTFRSSAVPSPGSPSLFFPVSRITPYHFLLSL